MLDATSLHMPPGRFSAQVGSTKDLAGVARTLNSSQSKEEDPELREAFDSFVGETFYGQMLSSLHKMHDKSAYFHGGRAEEVFQGQLDQALATEMTKANGHSFTDSLYHLFALNRQA
jgi:hypothetical protein